MDSSRIGIVIGSYFVGALLGGALWFFFGKAILSTARACAHSLWKAFCAPRPPSADFINSGGAEGVALRSELASLEGTISSLKSAEKALPTNLAVNMETAPESELWDRSEFLQACTTCVGGLSRLLDDVLCDAFEGPGVSLRLSTALTALLRGAAEEMRMEVTARRAAMVAASAPSADKRVRDACEASAP